MYRIDNATAVTSIPTPAAVGVNPNGYFFKGDPTSSQEATIVDDDWLNALQEEICNVIEASSITLDKTVRTQLLAAIQSQVNPLPYAASTNSPNTYTATLSPAILSYSTGKVVAIKFTNANTGAATLNLNGLGAKSIKRLDGAALQSGDINSSMIALLAYDGTNFQLLNQQTIQVSYIQNNSFIYATDVGAAGTLSATLSPSPASYAAGLKVLIKVNATNAGASTINLNGLGAKSIIKMNGNALTGGEMRAGGIAELLYDGTNFQLANPVETNSFTNVTKVTATGNFTVPAGIYKILVKAWGGGGGGAGSALNHCGGGGGSGSYSESYLNVTPGQVIACTIGAGGSGGTGANNGTAGGSTSFGAYVTCGGGLFGYANGTAGQGGPVGVGLYALPGLAGQGGNLISSSSTGTSGGGYGAGYGLNNTGSSGVANTGSGGAGGTNGTDGGAGGSGVIYVLY